MKKCILAAVVASILTTPVMASPSTAMTIAAGLSWQTTNRVGSARRC